MRKTFYFILFILFCFPIIGVNAITCNNKVLNVSDKNFMCNNIDGDKLTFLLDETDISEYFSVDNNIITINSNIKFPTNIEIAEIEVKDASSSTKVKIKNDNYITTTTTTTTKPLNIFNVTFDKQDGSELSVKKCSIIDGSNYCTVVLPKLNIEGFNGWGTKSECKEGISGTIKVYEDSKYYACYKLESVILKLKSLEILDINSMEQIKYDGLVDDKFNYDIKVLYEVDKVLIKTTTDDSSIKVIISNPKLEVGQNKVIIKLKDNKNNETVYTLNIERLKEGEPLKKIHYLSSLVVGGSEINFNKEIFEYDVLIDENISQLEINKIPFYENDIVTVRGNENLVNGSKVYIDVAGEDGSSNTYVINIKKDMKDNNILIFILIPCVFLLIIVCVIIFINKNKKSNKEFKRTKEKIKRVKNKAKKDNKPEVMTDNQDDIEVLKF